jgi:valyl-tRNA synthetase
MPFVTEEIWQKLPGTEGSIMKADFPDAAGAVRDEDASNQMQLLMAIVGAIRNIRGEMGISPGKKVETVMEVPNQTQSDFLNRYEAYIRNLAKVDAISLGASVPKPEGSATAVIGDVQVHVLLKGLIDVKEEKRRLTKETEKIIKELDGLRKKLANQAFLEKAPDEVVEEVRERVEGLTQRMGKVNQNLQILESMSSEQ